MPARVVNWLDHLGAMCSKYVSKLRRTKANYSQCAVVDSIA